MSEPFTALWCQPSYTARRVLIEWNIAKEYAGGAVYVARSMTGTGPWHCLNPDTPAAIDGNMEDTEFVTNNRVELVHYQLMLMFEGKRYMSPIVNLLQTLTRSEYGGARVMLKREAEDMRIANGLVMYHFALLYSSKLGDARTEQAVSAPCPEAAPLEFAAPIKTWIKPGSTTITVQDAPDGAGSQTTVTMPARMLSFPRPVRGHVLVDPISDDRYVVDKIVQAHRFRGIVAIAYDTTLLLLSRDDPRYGLVIPPLI